MRSDSGPMTVVWSDWYMFALGMRDEVLEAAGHGLPLLVHQPERRVAVADVLGDDAEGDDVGHLLEVDALQRIFLWIEYRCLKRPGDLREYARPPSACPR
jgi:hypothetical protein